ncbi:ATP-dependent RNA helicase HrpA [Nitrogeniibacter mangrovi]|uniref:ATP-dependent RNA helicase HrpA n=1 Tax=Nitrogeniibacter mangrovi TaxID=2016596 RepID=A0A6C1B5F8_9RHOO|nr:ATP-dependent RNA helicase HrpA [Nitrogeniibacter mangrovi]QID18956.1 ATP-dependent RNA helicase HrpA [Nitrogeniibacter mangrovi]
MVADRHRLSRDLKRLKPRPADVASLPDKLRARLEASLARRAARAAALPRPTFPDELPVSAQREVIAAALRAHQVVIVCGETGSGKTTQLPKLCLALGRGVGGLIGHTQPRRIAARTTAERIAEELGSPIGQAVGYKIRFTDRLSPTSHIKLMTDGILLAETQGDRYLNAYDTLIIDEAHERSLNIDFLLGYLKRLLPRRPDLKLIITSATIDAERFAHHFADATGKPAPVIEVSGRLYPIEMRYRPEEETTKSKRAQEAWAGLVDAVDEAHREGPGDILVFLPGEREIREAAEALRKAPQGDRTEILPLFARQSAQEQSRVFSRAKGRRVVLATNVAETSLTVPGIRYVIDTGLARIKRYSVRNKVEQLQIEPIAQSAARQRAGRCGRVSDGICIRLYGEDDFERRPSHTDPEILRASLAAVILRMGALELGDVADFPFIDPPTPRAIGDGYQLLQELGAMDEDKRLTELGRELARLPIDPKIGRMILAARDHGCLREVLVIAAALSVQDPRDRPQAQAGTADQKHALFRGGEQDQKSEFLWYWNLWKAFDEVQRHQSSNKQRQWCKAHFLSPLRMREWRDIHAQLHVLCAEHGWKENAIDAHYDAIHKALLTGLLGHLGCKAEEDKPAPGQPAGAYHGARGIKFWPHPGSSIAKKAGKWIVCAELVDTSRLFGRCLARVQPEWLEAVGAHLIKRHVFDPHWSKATGSVRAWERGTLHGVVLYARRPVAYRDVDPAECRRLFIREGLVPGEVDAGALRQMAFLRHNRRLVAEIERLEHKARRPDVLVDEALIEAFYDAKIPADVTDLASFEAWRKSAEQAEPKLLYLDRDQLMRHEAEGITTERFPAHLAVFGQRLKLDYVHAPGEADDGVTLTVPLAMLNQVPAHRCEWLVPGLLEEKVAALLRTVPQKHRHRLQPMADSVEAFLDAVEAGEWTPEQPLLKALQQFVEERVQLKLPLESFRPENLNPHCFMNFRVMDPHGRVMAQSRNLAELRGRFHKQVAAAFEAALASAEVVPATDTDEEDAPAPPEAETVVAEYSGLTDWSFGELPELISLKVGKREVIGFPALHDDGDSVSLRPFDTPEEAERVHRVGLARLFALCLKDQVKALGRMNGLRDVALRYATLGSEQELKDQLVQATLARTCVVDPLPTTAAAFAQRLQEAKPRITLVGQELLRLTDGILTERTALEKRLAGFKAHPAVAADLRAQLDALIVPRFLTVVPYERLSHYPRYLKAAGLRLDKLRNNPDRDAQLMADWQALHRAFEREWIDAKRQGVDDPFLEDFRWLLEELRVGLFAQELRTPMPVSVKRLKKIWDGRPR